MGFFEQIAPIAGGTIGFLAGGPMGAAAGAQIGSSFANYNMQQETNAQNKDLAREQMAYQTKMSNTAHQREVQDLQQAGLNPNLSAGGSGSSTPSGASANMVAPQIELPDMMAYGISIKQLEQADQRLALDKQNSAAQIAKTLSDTDLNKMKKILMKKGMVRAELEGEGAEILRKMIKFIKDGPTKPKSISIPGPNGVDLSPPLEYQNMTPGNSNLIP